MKGFSKDEFEDTAFERANKTTLLLKNRKDFHDVYEALKAGDEATFKEICKRANITDQQLVADMWDRWLKISEKKSKAAGPIW